MDCKNRPYPRCLLPASKPVIVSNHSNENVFPSQIYFFANQIFTLKVLHGDSFSNSGTRELGGGLLTNLKPRHTYVSFLKCLDILASTALIEDTENVQCY